MPSGNGPCRFGQYHRFHRLVLDELGYPQVPVYRPRPERQHVRGIRHGGQRLRPHRLERGIVAIDLLEKKLWETRPYERQPGESRQGLPVSISGKPTKPSRDRQRPGRGASEARKTFDDVALNGHGGKPIVGDRGRDLLPRQPLLQRGHRAGDRGPGGRGLDAAHRGVAALRQLSPPSADARTSRRYSNLLQILIKDWVQKRDEHRLDAPVPRQHQEPAGARHCRRPWTWPKIPPPLLRRGGHPQHGQVPGFREARAPPAW